MRNSTQGTQFHFGSAVVVLGGTVAEGEITKSVSIKGADMPWKSFRSKPIPTIKPYLWHSYLEISGSPEKETPRCWELFSEATGISLARNLMKHLKVPKGLT